MNPLGTVTYSTGSALADRVLEEVVALFERVYPGRVAAYYVEGSYADGTAVATSDLDVTIVFAAPFTSSVICFLLTPSSAPRPFLQAR